MYAYLELHRYYTELIADRRRTRARDITVSALLTAGILDDATGIRPPVRRRTDRLHDPDDRRRQQSPPNSGERGSAGGRNPDQLARVLADPELVPGWTEETLRVRQFEPDGLLQGNGRRRVRRSHPSPEGDRVLLLIGSANRDVDVFGPDVDKYILGRDNGQSLMSFGIRNALLPRLSPGAPRRQYRPGAGDRHRQNYEIDFDKAVRVHSVNVRGFAELPMKCRPADGIHSSSDRRPVLVAGASSGIGAATAEWLAAAGYQWRSPRRVDKLQALADKITAAGGEAVAVPLDVTDEQSVLDCVAKAEAALGALEVVVSGAGDLAVGRSFEQPVEQFTDQINIHLSGAYRLYRAVIPGMIERGRGDFVFIGSDVTQRPRTFSSAYVAAKSGIDGLAATVQMELEGTGVRAGWCGPGRPHRHGHGPGPEDHRGHAQRLDPVRHRPARQLPLTRTHRPGHRRDDRHARGAHMRIVEVEAEGAVPKAKRS